jgi:chromosome segregation ATPase
MTDPIEQIAQSLEAFDRRLSSIDARFVAIEGHLADDAQATDEGAKSLQKLQELYLSMDTRLSGIEALLANYVEETRGLRRSSQQLLSEVRERLRVAGG